MTEESFIQNIPYLYHLTASENLDFIKESEALFSTVELSLMTDEIPSENFITTRRPNHAYLVCSGRKIEIRDQKPITVALDKCLTPGWTRERFIRHLNERVFFWPNLHRLLIHYNRYKEEGPIIIRVPTEEALKLNPNPKLCRINSGATRANSYLGGKAPLRGHNTFLDLVDFQLTPSNVAEVTFEKKFILPDKFEVSNSPDGEWKLLEL